MTSFGLLEGEPLQVAVNLGAAHGALAMTTPGDTSMVTEAEVRKVAGGGSARVDRWRRIAGALNRASAPPAPFRIGTATT